MADGQGTHATQNRLEREAAIDSALLAGLHETDTYIPHRSVSDMREAFVAELREQRHVVGHETDRHHELLAQCAELIDRWDRLDRPRPCIGCQHLVGRPDDTHAEGCPIPAIRAIVAEPIRPAEPDPRGPRLVPRRDPHLCWRVHPGTDGHCQLPDGHDPPSEQRRG